MKRHKVHKGQIISFTFTDEKYKIKSFFGKSGIEFNTYEKARKCNSKGFILVKLTNNGAGLVKDIKLK